ncbi:ABC transporter substrate-binding protein [Litoreibacter roseus]
MILICGPAWAVDLSVHYIRVETPTPPTLSNLDPIPDDLGLAGAQTALDDNNTTGKFLGQTYALDITELSPQDDVLGAARAALAETPFLILDAPSDVQLAIADLPEAQDALLFNVSAETPDLRSDACRGNMLHTAPSVSMRTDALAQFFVTRRWTDLAMIFGTYEDDRLFADAMRVSLQKFGISEPAEKEWAFDADMRRNAAQEVPLFTQDLGDYDALIVADEVDDFGRYIPFNTWQARPVAGTEGLTPKVWAPVVEQWGAAQLQSRFTEAHGRDMASKDYAAWAAVRTLGEAVTRTTAADAPTLRAFILSDAFELAGFKGRPLTYRGWNGQLRQPIPLVHSRALVASAPLEGFLHQRNELDTLGLDKPNSNCTAFED